MKRFSDQIREEIEASCLTRYALAEQAGIPDSALSRFMSGNQGLSSSTLDKIAEVLGLQVRVAVQELRISRKPGRPKKEKPKMQRLKKLTAFEWKRLAQDAAKDAHEKNFPSRRGLYVVEGVGVVYYDNNPFELPRDKDRRENLISQFRDFLKRSKQPDARTAHIGRPIELEEKASAYYPTSGDSKDYTFAMAISAGPESIPYLQALLKAIRGNFLSIVDRFVNGSHEGIDLGHPVDGDTRRYTIPLWAIRDDEKGHPSTTAKKHGRRYPWKSWFARDRFTLLRGRDYTCRTYAMAQQVRNAAAPDRNNVGVSVETAENGESLTVTVLER